MICKHILLITFLNEPKLILCTQLNGFKYFNQTWIILFTINHFFVSVDETLLPRYVNLSTSFREVPSSVEMSPAWLKHIYSVLCALTWRPMPAAARSNLCSTVSVSSTEKDIDTRLTKAWTAIDKLSVIWKSDLTDKTKRSFFQEAVESILLYGHTTWTLTKRLEKKLDGNYTRMFRAILNKS